MKQRLPAFILFLFITSSLFAGDRYWIGGSGNWNDASHWSATFEGKAGATIPGANDNVYIGSFATGNDVITISGSAVCNDLSINQEEGRGKGNATVLKGTGEINIGGSLYIGKNVTDLFTGTWKFLDRVSCFRDNSIAEISTGGHVFTGKLIFLSPQTAACTNSYSISDKLFVNNSIEVQKRAQLILPTTSRIAALSFITDAETAIVSYGKKDNILFGNSYRTGDPAPPTPQSHTVTTVVVPNLCNGDCEATATAVVTGGSGNFIYVWSNGDGTVVADSLCAGTYLVVVTDVVNGDQVPAFAIVTDPPPLVIFFSNTSPLCNGMCNGSSSASVAGGTAPYTYLWAPNGETTPTITNQCAGVYTLTVTDSNGCTVTQPSVITQPAVLSPNGTRTNVTCFGFCDGTATVAPSGGTAPYSYSWSTLPVQTTPGITGLCAGSYTCTVTDNNGCQSTYVAVITEPALLQVSATHTNASCNGVCNGTATSTVAGGTTPYTYLWSPGNQTTPNLAGLCAGTYTLTVTDANGCTASTQVTITEPAPLIVAPTGVNIACFGLCTGTAAANVSGGTPGYTYSWAPTGGTGPTASSLCPNTYTVSVTDLNGCQSSGQVTITQPTQLLANSSGTNVTCFGACNGTATANGAGGIGPYTYLWQPGNINSQSISALCPGTYTVTVTDANGCTSQGQVTITQPNQLQPNVTSTNVTCNTFCNGSAVSNPIGGVGPYTYLWMPGAFTTNSINGLCAGSYTLTVTDANGCTQNQTVTITQPNPLNVSINATQIACNAVCNGAAASVVSGGTPPYSYLWSPNGETTPSISNLCAGSYTVTVTDANGCVNTASVTLIQPTALVLVSSVTNTSCNGSCNGSASISPSGGVGPYTYVWAPGGETTPSISNLCAGSYTITVTDASGCQGSATITVTEPQALSAGVTSNNVSCNGGCNGSANAIPSGGTGPYTFLWMPGGFTTSNVSGLCPGTYTVTITDANLCALNQQVSITQPSPLSAMVVATTSSCGNCNGTATVAVSGGTAPYAYFWTPSNQTNPTATNLCIGNYTVTVTDAAGCTTTATCTVLPIVNIIVTSSTTSLSCFGACDGIASANAAGGTNPYSYVWMPGNFTTQTVTGLCAGSYTVTATDANLCFNTAVVSFVDPPAVTATSASTDASCNGVCDGTASVTPSGGTGAYSYLWAPGGQTTQAISGLCVGTYTCTISDANNCTLTVTFTINEPTLITSNQVVSDANCTLCDGVITVNPAGGTGPYTYSWAPNGEVTQTISNLCPAVYTVTITDATGCAVTTPIAVSNLNGPTVVATSTDVSCNAVCDGTGNANVTGGASPFTYDWTGTPVGDGTPSVTGLCAGTHFCQVTDAVGCITFASITITEPQALTLSANIINVSCNGNSDGSITATPSGGTGPYSYLWAPGGELTQTISGQVAGTYTVTITDANLCSITQQLTITEPLLLTTTMAFTNVLCNAACNGTASLTVSGGSAPYTYSWSSGQGTANVANLCPGTYTVNIIDANGCTTQQTVTITEPTPLISSISSTDASCNGICDGTATVTASGGVPGYSYTWSPGGGTTPFAGGLCAGAYSVITLDTNGCSSVSSVNILQPSAIVLSASSGPLSCFGNCNGVAMVSASGGSPGYTYSWAPGGQTTATATALCAGTYTVTVIDLNGCSQNVSTTVAQPSLLQANTSFTSPLCNGGCNGTATANPVGGTGPYSYLWAPGGEATATISNLCAGTYTVTVYDANGCSDIQTVNVTPVSGMSVLAATAPSSCGNCDGTINVSPSGGTAPYTYAWSGGLPATPNQVNVCAGIYTLTLTDATGCTGTFTVVINNSGGPTGETVVTTDVTCPGSCDGTAIVTPIGGTGPYTYVWNPGGQLVNSLTNMCAGNYFLQVTDANGCIRFSPVVINSPPPIVGNPFVTNATCTGICDGAIALTPTGGTGPYTYSWAPNGQTTATISALCVGSYTATITDANGCTQTSASTVNPWNVLVANITSANPGCNNACNGSATVNISTGTAPFTYSWTDPLGQTTATATGLCAGTYNVTVTDGGGCSSLLPVTLSNPNPIVIAPTITPTTCGQCNGSATLNASGGTPPYTYLWSNGASTATVNGLCAGVYNVIISDNVGCTTTFTINISSSGGPTAANETIVNASCNGICDGSISLTPTGGIAPYTYVWLPGGQTTSSITNLCAGNYNVQIRDAAGCILTQSFTITSPSAIVANQLITNTDCGICAGSIALTPSGGTGPYTYVWAPGGQTTATINGLCAGLYTVTITDAVGCTQTQAIPVSNLNSGMTVTTGATGVTCNASCNGSATVTVVGGNAPYTYSWSNAATNDTITGLCAGNYVVQVIDATGCVSSVGATITQPSPLAGSYPFVQDELCTNACNGFITAIPSGGTLPYAYSWSTIPVQTTQTATNLCGGIYTVTITDANGCTLTQTDTINSPVVLVLSPPVVTDATCNNSPDGAIDLTVTGGALPYTYAWTGPGTFSATTQDISGVLFGSYTVTITDANGCAVTDTIVINALTSVVANAGNDTTSCIGGALTLDGSGSTNAVTYQWIQLPSGAVVSNGVTASVIPVTGTTAYVLIASNGVCISTDTVLVTSSPGPVADAGPDQSIITGMTVTIGGNPTGPVGSTYAWGPSSGLGDPTMGNPVASPSSTTSYTVFVTDANGCIGSDTMNLIVVPAIDFPNGFTPNGDGINDVWQIDNIQLFPECQVQVYNRWGELLFNSIGYNPPWDGRFEGKDVPVGTYYYIIKLNDPLYPDVFTGPLTIMR